MIKNAEGKKLYLETVLVKGVFWPERSDIRPATPEEVTYAEDNYELSGVCDHSIVFDERGFAYDLRYCAICGAPRGLI